MCVPLLLLSSAEYIASAVAAVAGYKTQLFTRVADARLNVYHVRLYDHVRLFQRKKL